MFEGHWELAGDTVIGWARDVENGQPLWLELVADGRSVAVTRADLEEPRQCGFLVRVPPAVLEEGCALEIRVANTEFSLGRAVVEAPEKEALSGELYVDRGLFLRGWAVDPSRIESKLKIVACIGGKVVADTVAGERCYRPAVADGHGFSLELPGSYADGRAHVVELRDERGRAVPGSPVQVRSVPEKLSSWFKGQQNSKAVNELLADMLDTVEERLPGIAATANYELWKRAFPVPTPQGKVKLSIEADARWLQGQQGVDLRRGEELVFLPGDAVSLHRSALALMAAAVRDTGAALIYADGEDTAGGPLCKGAWDAEAFLVQDYLGPCLVRRDVLTRAGLSLDMPREELRCSAIMAAAEQGGMCHLPLILSRHGPGGRDDARERWVNRWLAQVHPGAVYSPQGIIYPVAEEPLISIIIPTRDHGDLLETCLSSLWQTNWPAYEVIIIDNGSVESRALDVMAQAEKRDNVCVLRKPGVFDFAALNNEAVGVARGKYVCFLNNDTEAMHGDWLREMYALLAASGSRGGAVGAKLLWPNGLVQHGGVVVGVHQLAAHVGNQWLDKEPGYMGINQRARRCSVVTAACMLTPRELFLATGGFDRHHFPINFNDVDYCLRLGAQDKKILWTPRARLAHHESASRGKDLAPAAKARAEREMTAFRTRWGHYDDIFYNPNLPLSAVAAPYVGLAFPPRRRDARVA